jgi:hypothetical protein
MGCLFKKIVKSYCFMISYYNKKKPDTEYLWGRRGRDRMVVGFVTTYAISPYHH